MTLISVGVALVITVCVRTGIAHYCESVTASVIGMSGKSFTAVGP